MLYNISFSDQNIEFRERFSSRIAGAVALWFLAFIVFWLAQEYKLESAPQFLTNGLGLFLALAGVFYVARSGYGCFDKSRSRVTWKTGLQKYLLTPFWRNFDEIKVIRVNSYDFETLADRKTLNPRRCFGVWVEFNDGKSIEVEKIRDKADANDLAGKIDSFIGNIGVPYKA